MLAADSPRLHASRAAVDGALSLRRVRLAHATGLRTVAACVDDAGLPFRVVLGAVASHDCIGDAARMVAHAERAVLVAHATANHLVGTGLDRARFSATRNARIVLRDRGGWPLFYLSYVFFSKVIIVVSKKKRVYVEQEREGRALAC